jgi:hypothetical protein
MPIGFQKRPGSPVEGHPIVLVDRPIGNSEGQVPGVFFEGCDRTRKAGAQTPPAPFYPRQATKANQLASSQ